MLHARFLLDDPLRDDGVELTDFPSFGPRISPLQIAVLKNRPDLVRLFLDEVEPCEVNEEVEEEEEEAELTDYSPLVVAAWLGHKEIVQILLQSHSEGKNTEKLSDDNVGTVLHAASAQGHMEIVEFLSKDADINNSEGLYGTALDAAAYWDRSDVVDYLLSLSDAIDRNRLGEGALTEAARCGSLKTMKLLFEKGISYPDDQAPIWAADVRGRREILDFFYERSQDGKSGPIEFFNLLCYASFTGAERLQTLLDQGNMLAMIEENFHSENSPLRGRAGPLYFAVSGNHIPAAKRILQMSESFLFSGNPLFAAVTRNQGDILNTMLEQRWNLPTCSRYDRKPHGLNPDAPGENGDTPLHVAVRRGQDAIVEGLLNHGADPTRPNGQGDSPQQLANAARTHTENQISHYKNRIRDLKAKAKQFKEISNMLETHGLSPKSPWWQNDPIVRVHN